MDEAPQALPASLVWLKGLVIVLMVTMILGVIAVVALLVTRMPDANALPLPETIELPEGAKAQAVTVGPDWFAVVTTEGRILVYDRLSGVLRQEVEVTRP